MRRTTSAPVPMRHAVISRSFSTLSEELLKLKQGYRAMRVAKLSDSVDRERRHFLSTAAFTLATAQLGLIGTARAETEPANHPALAAIKPGTNTSFASLRQIEASPLNVGYAEAGS